MGEQSDRMLYEYFITDCWCWYFNTLNTCLKLCCCCCLVAHFLPPGGLQNTTPPCPSLSPGISSNLPFFHLRWYFLGCPRYEMWFSIVSWTSWVLCYIIYCIKPQMAPHVWENIAIISFCSVKVEVEVSHLALFNIVEGERPFVTAG